MYLVDVIPIGKGQTASKLTYFSKNDLPKGHSISVTVGNRQIPAIVLSSKLLSNEKAGIKTSDFTMKKIPSEEPHRQIFDLLFMRAIERLAIYQGATMGAVIKALVPQVILENISEINSMINSVNRNLEESMAKVETQKSVFQAPLETRLAHYRGIIRESFAKKQSVFILVPTIREAGILKSELEKGIEPYTHVLHSEVGKKNILQSWQDIVNEEHPILVVGTAIFLSIPRRFDIYIIENESSSHYKMNSRPFLDMRTALRYITSAYNSSVLYADTLLRIETIYRYESGELESVYPPKWHTLPGSSLQVVDIKKYNKDAKEFKIISHELEQLIASVKRTGRHLFIYVGKRGHSPQIVCRDCGTTVLCRICSAPVALHSRAIRDGKYLLCHTCGEKREVDEKCSNCESWNLEALGIGIDNVKDTIAKTFPDISIFQIDSDSTGSQREAQKQATEFFAKPGSVLIGTSLALSYITEPVEHIAVATLDSLFSLPDFRINEKIFHVLIELRHLATDNLIIQTRHIDKSLWKYVENDSLREFYKEEISQRAKYRYPPFAVLIKITYAGSPETVRSEMSKLKSYLNPYEAKIFPAFIETQRGQFTMHALIRVADGHFPDQMLYRKLIGLPPGYAVNVEPENLL